MSTTLEFDPNRYSEKALRLILQTAEQRQCTPAEAAAYLLNKLASRTRKAA